MTPDINAAQHEELKKCVLADDLQSGSHQLQPATNFADSAKEEVFKMAPAALEKSHGSRRSLHTSGLLICALSLFVCGFSSTQRSVGAERTHSGSPSEKLAISRIEEQWVSALNNANVDAINEILANDFSHPDPESGQFIAKSALLAYYRKHLARQSPRIRRIENMTVSTYGATAIARGVVIISSSDGHVISKLLFIDIFVKRQNRWQAISAQENRVPQQ